MQQTIHSKVKFPHSYMWKSLGGFDTEEGTKYSRRHHYEMMKEYEEEMKIFEYRFELGGNKEIHGLDATNNS